MNILHQNLKEFEINDKQINEISKITNLNNLDIINKIIFHYIDNDIYIYPQESGSCTWFSLYWSILIYYISKVLKELILHNEGEFFKFLKKWPKKVPYI